MKINMELEGDVKLLANLERTVVHVRREAQRFVREEAEAIFQESQEEVPVETGSLKASGFVKELADGSYTVGYGGENVQTNPKTGLSTNDYSLAVHERLDTIHPTGKAKFLEDPVNRHSELLEIKAAARLRRYLRGGS
jgi:hypothetical protein